MPVIFLNKVTPFVSALLLSLLIVKVFVVMSSPKISISLSDYNCDELVKKTIVKREPLEILSQPPATFTEKAKKNKTQGTVRLQVLFLHTGYVTNISPISKLPNGLTEQAVTAASKIKFKPERHYGEPVTTSKILEYKFNNATKDSGIPPEIKDVKLDK